MARRSAKSARTFLIYTAESVFEVAASTLAKAMKQSGIDDAKTPIVAAIEAHCIPAAALSSRGPTIAAIVIRNPYYQGDGSAK